MTVEVKKPKVRPEADNTQVAIEKKPEPARLVEVEILRKYVPEGQPQEIKQSVPPGTVLELPHAEAVRVLKNGAARATDRTFG